MGAKLIHSCKPGVGVMAKRSSYQQRVIRNYYENQGAILLQRLGDLVTDLYLAEGQNRARLWKRVATTLEKLKVPKERVQHLVGSDNPALLTKVLKELLEKQP
jgi:hypothetical protein